MKYTRVILCLAALFLPPCVHSSRKIKEHVRRNAADTERLAWITSNKNPGEKSNIFNYGHTVQRPPRYAEKYSESNEFQGNDNMLSVHSSSVHLNHRNTRNSQGRRKNTESKLIKRQANKNHSNATAEFSRNDLTGIKIAGVTENDTYDRLQESNRFFTFVLAPQRYQIVGRLFGLGTGGLSPLVHTAEGILRGKRIVKYGVRYYSFEGVPYAAVPERFQAPKPLKPWSGIKDALEEKGPCPQKHTIFDFYYGSEDCLHLNIHTPSVMDTKLNVMVVIHGGGFNLLSGSRTVYGPERFIEKNIIFITINYRLGALGFLSTQTSEAPGNAGMKDMIAALTWIQRNIHMFGGDASKVTLFGSSSGATGVEYLTLSKMSKGLFSKFIMQSGSALNYLFYNKDPIKYAIRLGSYLNYHTSDVHKLMTLLKNASSEDIVEASQKLGEDIYPLGISRPFSLCVENPLLGEEMFLHDHPENILLAGDFIKLPSMIGFNTLEGSEFIKELNRDSEFLNNVDDTFEYLLPTALVNAMDNPQQKQALINKVRQFYFNGERISNATAKNYMDMIGDNILLYGLFKSINIRVEKNDGPIYFWQFAYEGFLGVFKKYLSLGVPGVPHADETAYLFRMDSLDGYPVSSETEVVAQRLVTLLCNFMKYGNPTPNQTALLPVIWKPLEANNHLDYMEITEQMAMKQDPYPYMERVAFWKDIYENKNKYV